MPPQPSSYYSPNPLAAAKPTRNLFDPWNSSSTGHQRAENRLSGSTSWRDSRSLKLGEQFKGGQRGGKRVADTVGVGSVAFGEDGRLENGGWARGSSGLRKDRQKSLFECFGDGAKVGNGGVSAPQVGGVKPGQEKHLHMKRDEVSVLLKNTIDQGGFDALPPSAQPRTLTSTPSNISNSIAAPSTPPSKDPQIFRNLTIYINGSTFPTISDHKLKRLLASHGANLSIALGRRTVTHVILGSPNAAGGKGAGGGLASSKMQKEIANVRGKGVKFVGVEWVVESVRAGKRLPEAGFEVVRLAMKGQGSVWGALEKKGGVKELVTRDAGGG